MRKCDGKTEYTCTVSVQTEKGELKHWVAIDRDALEDRFKANPNAPADFTFPINRRSEDWDEACECPAGCRRMVRDTKTLSRSGQRMARRRLALNGSLLEVKISTFEFWKGQVTFVCVEVEEERTLSHHYEDEKEAQAGPSLDELAARLVDFEGRG